MSALSGKATATEGSESTFPRALAAWISPRGITAVPGLARSANPL